MPPIESHRTLGKSDVQVSPVIFGAWAIGGWMWGGTDESDAIAAIHAALANGVDTIDTAAIYGMGKSEELVARAIKGKRDRYVLATKCGLRWDTEEGSQPWPNKTPEGKEVTVRRNSKPDSIAYECEQSLRRLGTDYIDLYQVHQPDLETPVEDTMHALEKLRASGKIRAIGLSNFDVAWLERAAAVTTVASLQPPYSLITRKIEKAILPWCRQHEVGTIVYSPLERGLLTGKVSPDRVFPEGDHRAKHRYFTVENRERVLTALEKIKPIAERYDATLAQIVINWTLQEPGVTAAIVGARDDRQARQNAGALRFRLDDTERAALRAAFDSVSVEMNPV